MKYSDISKLDAITSSVPEPWLIAYTELPVKHYALRFAWMFMKAWILRHGRVRLELWSNGCHVVRCADNGGAVNND